MLLALEFESVVLLTEKKIAKHERHELFYPGQIETIVWETVFQMSLRSYSEEARGTSVHE